MTTNDLSKMVHSKGGVLVEDGRDVEDLRMKVRERERQRENCYNCVRPADILHES